MAIDELFSKIRQCYEDGAGIQIRAATFVENSVTLDILMYFDTDQFEGWKILCNGVAHSEIIVTPHNATLNAEIVTQHPLLWKHSPDQSKLSVQRCKTTEWETEKATAKDHKGAFAALYAFHCEQVGSWIPFEVTPAKMEEADGYALCELMTGFTPYIKAAAEIVRTFGFTVEVESVERPWGVFKKYQLLSLDDAYVVAESFSAVRTDEVAPVSS